MGWKSILSIIIVAFLLRKTWTAYWLLQPFKVVYNHAPGECHMVSPVVSGSEDMQMLDANKVLITSGLKFGDVEKFPERRDSIGQIFMYDFSTPQKAARAMACDNFPDYGTSKFSPHGMFIYKHGDKTLIFTVNHPLHKGYETVEKFSFDVKTEKLHHLKTYTSELFRSANDVVAVGPDTFYVTNLGYYRKGILQLLEMASKVVAWSNIIYHDRGTYSVAADSFFMANGIHLSPDSKYMYMYEGGRNSLHVYLRERVAGEDRLTLVQTKVLDTTSCDNVGVEVGTGDIWLGCHSVPYKTMHYIDMPAESRPLSPSQVLRIKTNNGLLTDDVTEVYHNDGTQFQASTIVVYHAKTSSMLVGSIDNTLMHCKVNYLPATRK